MYAAGGVGLAAPQIGVPKRVAVIDVGPMGGPEKLYAIINPELVEARGEVTVSEGCLSFPDINEDVVRAKAVVVRALDADGNEQVIAADTDTEGILPVALQHELDHLEGVLLIDRLSVLRRELIKRRMRKNRRAASGR
jgi:peptide deformylase